jgi:hypothetical protein
VAETINNQKSILNPAFQLKGLKRQELANLFSVGTYNQGIA